MPQLQGVFVSFDHCTNTKFVRLHVNVHGGGGRGQIEVEDGWFQPASSRLLGSKISINFKLGRRRMSGHFFIIFPPELHLCRSVNGRRRFRGQAVVFRSAVENRDQVINIRSGDRELAIRAVKAYATSYHSRCTHADTVVRLVRDLEVNGDQYTLLDV